MSVIFELFHINQKCAIFRLSIITSKTHSHKQELKTVCKCQIQIAKSIWAGKYKQKESRKLNSRWFSLAHPTPPCQTLLTAQQCIAAAGVCRFAFSWFYANLGTCPEFHIYIYSRIYTIFVIFGHLSTQLKAGAGRSWSPSQSRKGKHRLQKLALCQRNSSEINTKCQKDETTQLPLEIWRTAVNCCYCCSQLLLLHSIWI